MTFLSANPAMTSPAPALPPVPVCYRHLIIDDREDEHGGAIISLVSATPLTLAHMRTTNRGERQ